MSLKRRQFSKEFKLSVIREIEAGKSQAEVARAHQVNPNTLTRWRKQLRQYKDQAFAGNGHAYSSEARVAELERMVGRLTMENDFLKKVVTTLETKN